MLSYMNPEDPNIQNETPAPAPAVKSRLAALRAKAGEAASKATSSVKGAIPQGVKDTASKATGAVSSAASKATSSVKGAIPQGVKDTASKATGAVSSAASKAKSTVSSVGSKVYDTAHRATGYKDFYDMAEQSTKYYDGKEIRNACKVKEDEILKNDDLKKLIKEYKENNTPEKIDEIKKKLKTLSRTGDLYFLDCTSGKLLKYLIRLELKAYKKCIKTKKGPLACKKSDMLKIVKLQNNNFVLDTVYLIEKINELNGRFTKLKTDLGTVKTQKIEKDSSNENPKISQAEIKVLIKKIIPQITKQSGAGCRQEANEYYMMGMLLLIVGVGIFLIFMGAIVDMACDFVPRKLQGGYKNNKLYSLDYSVNMANLHGGMKFDDMFKSTEETIYIDGMIGGIDNVIEIFNSFKSDVTALQNFKVNKDQPQPKKLEKVCTYVNKDICFESRKNLDFIKKLLKSIDDAYEEHDKKETEPGESVANVESEENTESVSLASRSE